MLKIWVIPLQIILLLAVCNSAQAQSNQSESLTISTYYPSPYGVYRNLEVRRGIAVGNIAGGPLLNMNNLQSGQMYINGSVVMNALNTDPAAAVSRAGQMIYNGPDKMLKFFNGTDWVNATGGSNSETIIIPPSGTCPVGYTRINHWLSAQVGGGCLLSFVNSIHPTTFGCSLYDASCVTPEAWSDLPPTCSYAGRSTSFNAQAYHAERYSGQAVTGAANSYDKSACLKNN